MRQCSSLSALCQRDLRGGAGRVCLAGVLGACQDYRSGREHAGGAKVGSEGSVSAAV